jgi:hypothetical protein
VGLLRLAFSNASLITDDRLCSKVGARTNSANSSSKSLSEDFFKRFGAFCELLAKRKWLYWLSWGAADEGSAGHKGTGVAVKIRANEFGLAMPRSDARLADSSGASSEVFHWKEKSSGH